MCIGMKTIVGWIEQDNQNQLKRIIRLFLYIIHSLGQSIMLDITNCKRVPQAPRLTYNACGFTQDCQLSLDQKLTIVCKEHLVIFLVSEFLPISIQKIVSGKQLNINFLVNPESVILANIWFSLFKGPFIKVV